MVGVAHMYCDAWIPVYFVAHAGSNFVIGEQFGSNLLGPARGGAIDHNIVILTTRKRISKSVFSPAGSCKMLYVR